MNTSIHQVYNHLEFSLPILKNHLKQHHKQSDLNTTTTPQLHNFTFNLDNQTSLKNITNNKTIIMPFTYRRRARATPRTTTTTRPRRSIFPRRRVHHTHHTTHTTHTTHAPVHHQKRRPSFKDKVSGALLRMKGSLTHRPAVKVR